MFRLAPQQFLMFLLTLCHASGGESYFTGFETPTFAVGDDKIAGTDGWIGTSAHNGKGIHGIMAEGDHLVSGLGNAAFMGGNYQRITGVSANTVYLRRPVNIDPLAINQEVATFNVSLGIKDSSASSLNLPQSTNYRRDVFDLVLVNSLLQQLGGIQFDNNTLDSTSITPGGTPRRLIWRLAWNGSAWQYSNTTYTFVHDEVEMLEIRINFRTNRWTATLGGVPLFQDITFYTGSNARTFGSMLVQMQVKNRFPSSTDIYPGDNYMLFDNYTVRTDPVTTTLDVSKTGAGGAKLTWNEEAGYSYRLQYSADCVNWLDFAATVHTAASTADYSYTDPTSPVPGRRFYRVKRTYP